MTEATDGTDAMDVTEPTVFLGRQALPDLQGPMEFEASRELWGLLDPRDPPGLWALRVNPGRLARRALLAPQGRRGLKVRRATRASLLRRVLRATRVRS
jgi:hypothetical protein